MKDLISITVAILPTVALAVLFGVRIDQQLHARHEASIVKAEQAKADFAATIKAAGAKYEAAAGAKPFAPLTFEGDTLAMLPTAGFEMWLLKESGVKEAPGRRHHVSSDEVGSLRSVLSTDQVNWLAEKIK